MGVLESVPVIECNADADHPCDANDGSPCHECQANEAEFRREWERTGRREYAASLTYRQDMIDAGRGHLLKENER